MKIECKRAVHVEGRLYFNRDKSFYRVLIKIGRIAIVPGREKVDSHHTYVVSRWNHHRQLVLRALEKHSEP